MSHPFVVVFRCFRYLASLDTHPQILHKCLIQISVSIPLQWFQQSEYTRPHCQQMSHKQIYKKQQSLYAIYDCVIEEFEKVVSRKRIKKVAMSSSDSDSEYFSPEEVDGIKRKSEKEYYSVSYLGTLKQESDRGDCTDEVPKIEATKFEEQLTSLTKEVESLSQQKKNLELQVESQTHEVKHLPLKNIELTSKIKKEIKV